MNGKYCRIHFRVKANAELGQTIGVTGSVSTLGNFNTKKVVQLVTTPESYPIWYTLEPVVVPKGRKVSYSFCIIESGRFKELEETACPRSFVPNEADVVIEEEFCPKKKIEDNNDEDVVAEGIAERKHNDSTSSLVSLDSLAERTIYVTCYHLPVTVIRSEEDGRSTFIINWNHSLISMRGDNSIFYTLNKFWVGTVSVPGEKLTGEEEDEVTAILAGMRCIPLFLDDDLIKEAYFGYCKQVLWPTFHNIEQVDHMHAVWRTDAAKVGETEEEKERAIMNFWDIIDKENEWYQAYNDVTIAFAEKMKSITHSGDIVWVHDYHLMLLPGMLRQGAHPLRIVFFLHIPFPTSQAFRPLANAVDILQSVLESDVVGFHTFDYARHFLHATRRMLGCRSHPLPGGLLAVTFKSREVVISMNHVSIEPTLLNEAQSDPETAVMRDAWKAKYKGRKIFVGVDTCQRLSGCLLKLEAFRMFLEDSFYPEKHVLVMYSLRPQTRPEDEEYTSRDLHAMVDTINSKYRTTVVDYIEREKLSLSERLALWMAGDVFVVTCIREGLNFNPMEYIYARKDSADAGVVIASDFSACSSVLNGSVKVNPFNFRQVADAMLKGVNMSLKEKESRRMRDLKFVQTHNSAQWTNQILTDLTSVESLTGHNVVDINCDDDQPYRRSNHNPPLGLAHPLLHTEVQESIPLFVPHVLRAYENALSSRGLTKTGTRVFILDYGGTIISKQNVDVYMKQTVFSVSGRAPDASVMAALKLLSEDPNNAVIIMTSLSRKKLGDIFDQFENITISTSNGMVCSWGKNIVSNGGEDSNIEVEESQSDSSDSESDHSTSKTESDEDESDDDDANGIFRSHPGFKKEGIDAPRSPSPTPSPRESLLSSSPRGRPVSMDSFVWRRKDSASFRTNRKWDHMNLSIDWETVKNIAVPLMDKFTTRTNGTYMTQRVPGMGWSYFGADPEWGEKQAMQLKVELETALVSYDVQIVKMPGSLEITPRIYNKVILITSLIFRVIII